MRLTILFCKCRDHRWALIQAGLHSTHYHYCANFVIRARRFRALSSASPRRFVCDEGGAPFHRLFAVPMHPACDAILVAAVFTTSFFVRCRQTSNLRPPLRCGDSPLELEGGLGAQTSPGTPFSSCFGSFHCAWNKPCHACVNIAFRSTKFGPPRFGNLVLGLVFLT